MLAILLPKLTATCRFTEADSDVQVAVDVAGAVETRTIPVRGVDRDAKTVFLGITPGWGWYLTLN